MNIKNQARNKPCKKGVIYVVEYQKMSEDGVILDGPDGPTGMEGLSREEVLEYLERERLEEIERRRREGLPIPEFLDPMELTVQELREKYPEDDLEMEYQEETIYQEEEEETEEQVEIDAELLKANGILHLGESGMTLDKSIKYPLGKYAGMRRLYLMNHKKALFKELLQERKFWSHLEEIEESASRRVKIIMERMLKKDPPPDKAKDQMGWVGYMEKTKALAEEMILELLYE
jgi:hypothetical protein